MGNRDLHTSLQKAAGAMLDAHTYAAGDFDRRIWNLRPPPSVRRRC